MENKERGIVKIMCGTCLILGLLLGIILGSYIGIYQMSTVFGNLIDNVHVDSVDVKFNSTEILNGLTPVLQESSAQTCEQLGYRVN